jgi:hypothetical protein
MLVAVEYRKRQHSQMLSGFHDEYGLAEKVA